MMHTIEIPEEGIVRYLPSDLSECSPQQYMDMSELIFLYQSGQLDYNQFKVHAVYKLLQLKPEEDKRVPKTPKEKKEKDIAESQKWVNIYALSNLIEGFFETNSEKQQVIKQYYIHNPIPSIALWRRYYGPQDQFKKITYAEYLDVLRLYYEFNASGNVEFLYLIAAVFYRPKKPFLFIRKHFNNYNDDVRVPYNSNLIERRAKWFKRLPIGFVFGVYLLFASYQKFISSNKIPWGGKEIDLSILFSSDGTEPQDEEHPGLGMDSIMFGIVEKGYFGTKKETMNTDYWEVLALMYDLRKRDLDNKKQEKDDRRTEN